MSGSDESAGARWLRFSRSSSVHARRPRQPHRRQTNTFLPVNSRITLSKGRVFALTMSIDPQASHSTARDSVLNPGDHQHMGADDR